MTDRRLLAIAGVAVTLGLAGAAGAHDGAMPGYRMMSPGFWTCPLCTGTDAEGAPGMGMGPGMMGGGMGYGMGPGMMGPGMGYGMGPGMMGPGMGYGMGPGMMGGGMGYGMGPGMMGPGMGYGMGPGMMGGGMGYGMGPGMGSGTMGLGMAPGGAQPLERDLTAEAAQHILEHRLAWGGNPNLKLGKVELRDDDTIDAEIVTKDGSLVDRLEVDRHTGRIQPVR